MYYVLMSGRVTIFHVCCVSSCSPILATGQCRDVHTVSSGKPPLLYNPLSALQMTCAERKERVEKVIDELGLRVCLVRISHIRAGI